MSVVDGRKWHPGVSLGMDPRTGQHILYDGESIKLARTFMQVPEANKWDKDALSKVHVTPWDLHRPRD